MPSRSKIAFLLLLCGFALAGCGGGDPESKTIDYDKALAEAPPRLATLYENGDALIPGGIDAFHERLQQLRGLPVVANVWGSWCVPCRSEFPEFQSVSAKYGDRVAFIGVDTEDAEDAARTFLREFPLPYPSVVDPDKDVQQDLSIVGLPGTAFYDRKGELVHLKQGPYASEEELAADIDRYAN
jgi:cytochrome c biogenesis protein CcmG/thiol:disulfide interchange protein DsbE